MKDAVSLHIIIQMTMMIERILFALVMAMVQPAMTLSTVKTIASLLASSSLFSNVFLPAITTVYPLSNLKPQVNIPSAISKFYPLPEEELLNSYSRGNALLIQGQFQDALRELNRALEISPDNTEALMSRGITYEKLRRWTDAIEDYKHANKVYKSKHFGKDDATALSNMANAETGLNEWTSAMRDFTSAAKLKTDFLAPQIGRALVSYQIGDKESALSFFKSLCNSYPSFPDGLAAYAVMTYESGNLPLAIELWDDAIELDDRYEDVDWVEKIRRWPPSLVKTLQNFISSKQQME